MARRDSTSITRRRAVAGLALTAAPLVVAAPSAHAQAKQTSSEKSLYERLGGVFCGSPRSPVAPSSSPPPSLARLRLASRRPTATSKSPPQNSMRSPRNSDGASILPRSPSRRRPKSWRPSRPTKTRSPLATSRPLSAAEASCVARPDNPASKAERDCWLAIDHELRSLLERV